MTTLITTSSILQVVTGSAVTAIDVHASYVDLTSAPSYTPGSSEVEITTAATTSVVSSPGAGVSRRIKKLTVRNSSTQPCQVTVQHYDGTITADLFGVTLLGGETLQRTGQGGWLHLDATGAPYVYVRPQPGFLGIAGSKAETIPRQLVSESSASVANGTLLLVGIRLEAGMLVSSISFFSSSTAAGTPTNQIFCLYNKQGQLLAQSANDTTTAWAANSIKKLNLTSPFLIPTGDMYYIGLVVTATTMPNMKSGVGGLTSGISTRPFLTKVSSTTGLTTTLPDPALTASGLSAPIWGCVS
mgnify:CR=1 FL=1